MNAIPQSVEELVDVLAEMAGAVAVVLGGSRAVRSEDEGSDWDLGVYYRGEIDLTALILRDLNVVEYWTRRAEEGESIATRCSVTSPACRHTFLLQSSHHAACCAENFRRRHLSHLNLRHPLRRSGAFAGPSISNTRVRTRNVETLRVSQARRRRL